MLSDFDEVIEREFSRVQSRKLDQKLEGKLLARLFSKKNSLRSESVRVVCTANDVRQFGDIFLETIDTLTTGQVSLSCYWNDYLPAPIEDTVSPENFLPDLAPVTHQYHDTKNVSAAHVVIVTTNIGEPATVVGNLSRTRKLVNAAKCTVVAPTASHGELTKLLHHFHVRDPHDDQLPRILLGLRAGHPLDAKFAEKRRSSRDLPLPGEHDIPDLVMEKMSAKADRRLTR